MFKRVADDPAAITRGWSELEEALGSLRGRKFYGAFDATIREYRVCVEIRKGDLPDELGLELGRLPGGRYLQVRLRGEPPGVYDLIRHLAPALVHVVFWRKDDRNVAAAPSRPGGPPADRAFVATSQPIPAKADRPNEPPHNPRNRHCYMPRPTRRARQPILIAVVGNELRPTRSSTRSTSFSCSAQSSPCGSSGQTCGSAAPSSRPPRFRSGHVSSPDSSLSGF